MFKLTWSKIAIIAIKFKLIKEFLKPQEREIDAHEFLKEFLKTLSIRDMKSINEKQEIKKMDQEIEIIFKHKINTVH